MMSSVHKTGAYGHTDHTPFIGSLFVLLRASPFSAASLLFTFEAVWSSLIYPADTLLEKRGLVRRNWAVPFSTKF